MYIIFVFSPHNTIDNNQFYVGYSRTAYQFRILSMNIIYVNVIHFVESVLDVHHNM